MADDASETMEPPSLGKSPPAPATSSVGASCPPHQTAHAGLHRQNLTSRKATLSSASAVRPHPGISTSTACASTTPSSHRPACRPWHAGDLFQRLATFKPSAWAQLPQIIGPLACARRGWVNIGTDTIKCEGCGAHLIFSTSKSWSQNEVDSAVEAFWEKLDTGHRRLCPWRGNTCSESIGYFLSSPPSALIGAYNDRCDALLQFAFLPVVSSFAIDQMKLSRGPQIERLLSQHPSRMITGEEFACESSMPLSYRAFYKAQKVIGLCGWEARLLPSAAEYDNHSAQSTRNACSVGPSKSRAKKHHTHGSKHLTSSKVDKDEVNKGSALKASMKSSALLECSFCGANLRISAFRLMARPPVLEDPLYLHYEASDQKISGTPVCNASAASNINGWYASEHRQQLVEVGETTVEVSKIHPEGLLDLNLTIAGGPPPTMLSPAFDNAFGQAEGSEIGNCGVAFYESREQGIGRDDTSNFMPGTGCLQAESVNVHGTDDMDDGIIRDGDQSYAAESSKRKWAAETSPMDQQSFGMIDTGPASDINVTIEADTEEVGCSRKKKRKVVGDNQGRVRAHFMNRQLARDLPCSSSVNATETCYQENSVESVDFLPVGAAYDTTAASRYEEPEMLEDPTSSLPARQNSSCVKNNSCHEDEETDIVRITYATDMDVIGTGMIDQKLQSHGGQIVGGIVFPEPQTQNVAGEVDVVTEHQGLPAENVTQDTHGQLPRVAYVSDRHDGNKDSHEATLSQCPKVNSTKGTILADDESARCGFRKGEKTVDTTNAVIIGGSTNASIKEGDDSESADCGSRSSHWEKLEPEEERSITTSNALMFGGSLSMKENGGGMEIAKDQDDQTGANSMSFAHAGKVVRKPHDLGQMDFDPIRSHRHFCPWMNGFVLTAINCRSFPEDACNGWQLTVDALDAYVTQCHVPDGATESESTASMCKVDSALEVQKTSSWNSYRRQKRNITCDNRPMSLLHLHTHWCF